MTKRIISLTMYFIPKMNSFLNFYIKLNVLYFCYLNFLSLNGALCTLNLYIRVQKENSENVEGMLMVRNQKENKSHIIQYESTLSRIDSNRICEKMNYDSIHSINYYCKSKKSYRLFKIRLINGSFSKLYILNKISS